MSKYIDLYDLAERNSAYANVYAAAIESCREAAGENAVVQAVDNARSATSQIQPASAIIDTLVRHGAIARDILVDGVHYAGTLADAQSDESLPDDAEISVRLSATPEGLEFARTMQPENLIEGLFAMNPGEAEGLRRVLAFVAKEPRTTAEVQDMLRQAGLLRPDERGVEQIHASYFTGALENVGALAWNKGAWEATDAGRAVMA